MLVEVRAASLNPFDWKLRLVELVDKEIIKAQVDKIFPLEQAKEAFDYLEKGHPRGKVVVKIKE